MNSSTAYQNGYEVGAILGVIIGFLIMGGLLTFFIIALVKAFTTKKTGWVVGAILSSLPIIGMFILFIAVFVAGFKKGFSQSREIAAARRGESSELLTAPMTPINGNVMAYEVSLPSIDSWDKKGNHSPYDYLFSRDESYVGIIAENVGLQTPDRVCALTQKNIRAKTTDYSFTDSQPIDIDSRPWLTYDATATIKGVQIKYRFYVYADEDHTIQIITWTVPMLFDHDAPVFDRIAKSFKMPK